MVIRPLDDPIRCAQSAVADLRPICLGYVGIGMNSFGSPPLNSYSLPIDTYGLYQTVLKLFSWLQKCFRPSVCPSDTDMMTNTAIEAIASSSGNKSEINISAVVVSGEKLFQFYITCVSSFSPAYYPFLTAFVFAARRERYLSSYPSRTGETLMEPTK